MMHVFSSRDVKGTIGMLRGRVSWTVTIGVGVFGYDHHMKLLGEACVERNLAQ